MSKSAKANYNSEEYLDIYDSLSGAVHTLEIAVDDYVSTLGEYIANDSITNDRLEQSIEFAVDSLERVYDSLESMDDLLEDENMVARIEREGNKGFCDLEKNLERVSSGIYSDIDSLNDLMTLFHYIEKDDFEADQEHVNSLNTQVEAPTRIVYDKQRLEEVVDDLNTQYNRLIFSEALARRHTESEQTLEAFNPQPPIFRILGHPDYRERINKLDKKFKKKT